MEKQYNFCVKYEPDFTEEIFDHLVKWVDSIRGDKKWFSYKPNTYKSFLENKHFWVETRRAKKDNTKGIAGVDTCTYSDNPIISLKELCDIIGYNKDTKFEVGKWYITENKRFFFKYTGNIKGDYIYTKEWINREENKFKTLEGAFLIELNHVPISISEIAQYLPKDHPDLKLLETKSTGLKPEDMVKDKCYHLNVLSYTWIAKFSHLTTDLVHISKGICYNGNNSIIKAASFYIKDINNLREATIEEIKKYFPEEKIETMKEHPLIIEAKKRYPPGTKFYAAHGYKCTEQLFEIPQNGYDIEQVADMLVVTRDSKKMENGDRVWACIKYGDKWAEIIKEPKSTPLVFGLYNIGDIVVSKISITSGNRKEGDLIKVNAKSNKDTIYYNNSDGIEVTNKGVKEWRAANREEIEAYNNGIRNIKDIKKEDTINTYGLKVGDIIPVDVINTWSDIEENYYSLGWKKQVVKWGQGTHKITGFEINNNKVRVIINHLSTLGIKAEGFKEFMENYNKPKEKLSINEDWCIKLTGDTRQTIIELCKIKSLNTKQFSGNSTNWYYGFRNSVITCADRPFGKELSLEQLKEFVDSYKEQPKKISELKPMEDLTGRYVQALVDKPNSGNVKKGSFGRIKDIDCMEFPEQKSYWDTKALKILSETGEHPNYKLMPIGWSPDNQEEFKVGDWVVITKCQDQGYSSSLNGEIFQVTRTSIGPKDKRYVVGNPNLYPKIRNILEGGIYFSNIRKALPHEIPKQSNDYVLYGSKKEFYDRNPATPEECFKTEEFLFSKTPKKQLSLSIEKPMEPLIIKKQIKQNKLIIS